MPNVSAAVNQEAPMRRSLVTVILTSATMLMLGTSGSGALSAAGNPATPAQASGPQDRTLEGTWRVQITLRDCQTGNPLGIPFLSLVTYARGGTATAATARVSPALLSPFYGVWAHSGGHTFTSVAQAFLFNPAGVSTGTQTLRQAIEFGGSPDEYSVTATIEIANPVGTVVSTGCASAEGMRMTE
jgi:hypothetical protein